MSYLIEKKQQCMLKSCAINTLDSYKSNKHVIEFINSLDDASIIALNVAIEQLGSSFDIEKSIGFMDWKNKSSQTCH